MRDVWDNVALRIQQGSSLGDAMANHRCFAFMVVRMVRVGEQTGTLDKVVARAAETLERRRLLRTQLLTALTYPAIVLMAAVGVSVFMIVTVIPQLKIFLTALGRRLPPITQRLLDVSDFVTVYGPAIGIGLAVSVAGLTAVYLWPPGRLAIDSFLLRLPLIGRLLRLAATRNSLMPSARCWKAASRWSKACGRWNRYTAIGRWRSRLPMPAKRSFAEALWQNFWVSAVVSCPCCRKWWPSGRRPARSTKYWPRSRSFTNRSCSSPFAALAR